MEAFCDSTVNSVVDLFPPRLLFKMERLPFTGKEKLEGIVEIMEEERMVIQKVANRSNSAANTSKKQNKSDPPAPVSKSRVSTAHPVQPNYKRDPKLLNTD